MSTATLDGKRASAVRLQVASWGVAWAAVTLPDEHTLEIGQQVELVVADLTVRCAVVSGGVSGGRSTYRLASGAGGWARDLPEQSYQADGGVRLATVLEAAALEAGETLDASTVPDVRLGEHFTRPAGRADFVLRSLVPAGWYVGEDGTTRVGQRSAGALPAGAVLGPLDVARGTVTIAADSVSTILPGLDVPGLGTVVDVELEVSASGGLRCTVWGAGPLASTARLPAAVAALVEYVLPALRFAGAYEYRVVTRDGDRVNVEPVRVSSRMPALRKVRCLTGLPGTTVEPGLGSVVVVQFLDRDPSRPVATSFDETEVESISLGGGDVSGVNPVGRVVRYGDSITFSSPGPGTVMIGDPSPISRVSA